MTVQRGYALRRSIASACQGGLYAADKAGAGTALGRTAPFYQGRVCMRAQPCLKSERNKVQADYHIHFFSIGEEVRKVNIIVHFPKDREMQRELSKKVASVHAQTVIEKVKAMPCPLEQKAELLDAIKRYIQSGGGA